MKNMFSCFKYLYHVCAMKSRGMVFLDAIFSHYCYTELPCCNTARYPLHDWECVTRIRVNIKGPYCCLSCGNMLSLGNVVLGTPSDRQVRNLCSLFPVVASRVASRSMWSLWCTKESHSNLLTCSYIENDAQNGMLRLLGSLWPRFVPRLFRHGPWDAFHHFPARDAMIHVVHTMEYLHG